MNPYTPPNSETESENSPILFMISKLAGASFVIFGGYKFFLLSDTLLGLFSYADFSYIESILSRELFLLNIVRLSLESSIVFLAGTNLLFGFTRNFRILAAGMVLIILGRLWVELALIPRYLAYGVVEPANYFSIRLVKAALLVLAYAAVVWLTRRYFTLLRR